jgi:iron-sulfur cluster assembly protein
VILREDAMANGIEISETAAARIRAMSAEKGTPAGGLRLGVKGGGCSGLSYQVDWAAGPTRLDQVVEREGARVFVDPKSAVFLAGTVVDFQRTLMQSGFVFRNPNVKSACGCGESFTI